MDKAKYNKINMKKELIILMLSFGVVGCINQQSQPKAELSEDEFQKINKEKNEVGMIAIETTFEPTLELTDEIRNSTLEELIMQGKGKLSKYDQMQVDEQNKIEKREIEAEKRQLKSQGYTKREIDEIINRPRFRTKPKPTYEYAREYKLRYVSKTSNLAKVYYLEDMGRFIEHNQDYYNELISKIQNDSQQNQEQKNWDKYLK